MHHFKINLNKIQNFIEKMFIFYYFGMGVIRSYLDDTGVW